MRDEESLMYPPLDDLLEKIPDKYALVLTATKRAKHIIMQNRLNPTSAMNETDNRKPLSIALREIAEGNVDQSALDIPEPLLDDYVDDEMPVYVDLNEPIEPAGTKPEGEASFVTEPPVVAKPEVEKVVDDLADVEEIPDFGLDDA